MITYPQIDPVLINIGPLAIHWYGMMYVIGILIAWLLALYRRQSTTPTWSKDEVSDLIFYAAIGVIAGGRIGYMLFYNFFDFIHEPWILFKIWEGGMSFHGGLLGVVTALIIFSRRFHRSFAQVGDFLAPFVPLGLAAGRIGNFINAELWGRTTQLPWAMVFPNTDGQPRHPSQLYEFFLEGIVLFIILFWFSRKPRPPMAVTALFLLGYGCARFFCEFFREPDLHLGFVALNRFSMGQLLSLPMIIIGSILFIWAYKRKNA